MRCIFLGVDILNRSDSKGRWPVYSQLRVLKFIPVIYIFVSIQDVEMKTNARKDAGIVNPHTSSFLELDIFLPSLKLAFEYQVFPPASLGINCSDYNAQQQDLHHYMDSAFIYKPTSEVQKRDDMKKNLARAQGVTLIPIPCWWDGRENRLACLLLPPHHTVHE